MNDYDNTLEVITSRMIMNSRKGLFLWLCGFYDGEVAAFCYTASCWCFLLLAASWCEQHLACLLVWLVAV